MNMTCTLRTSLLIITSINFDNLCVQKNSSRTTLKAGVQRIPWWSIGGLSAYTAEGKLCGPSGKKKKKIV